MSSKSTDTGKSSIERRWTHSTNGSFTVSGLKDDDDTDDNVLAFGMAIKEFIHTKANELGLKVTSEHVAYNAHHYDEKVSEK